ncbi:MAG: hypothetical protein M1834_002384 [Cirrosporium novae-zelandiae]|nr:MAG: hypothetical protein M1834_002384 [Cirrosporium novae-zelandiae]
MASTGLPAAMGSRRDEDEDRRIIDNALSSRGAKSMEEPDTCRICRGEGSLEEPLFYPCKCSGSIKFVHQSCLMEWLAHSQKKYCELCKTRFRFTKLYRPDMPQSVPMPIFLKQAVIQSFHAVTTWSRYLLVAFVWLCLLPYSMRHIWKFLFWMADGGLDPHATEEGRMTNLIVNGTTPGMNGTSSAMEPGASAWILDISRAISSVLSKAERGFKVNVSHSKEATTTSFSFNVNDPSQPPMAQGSTWLSEVRLLKELTPSSKFNQAVIDTLEGQLITLAVVVAFIIIFLIREWVVQQQPALNVGAGAAMDDVNEPVPEERVPDVAENRDGHEEHANEAEEMGLNAVDELNRNPFADPNPDSAFNPWPYEDDQSSSSESRHEDQQIALPFLESDSASSAHPASIFEEGQPSNPQPSSGEEASLHRPSMPARDAIAEVNALRRAIEEEQRAAGNQEVKILMQPPSNVQPGAELQSDGSNTSWEENFPQTEIPRDDRVGKESEPDMGSNYEQYQPSLENLSPFIGAPQSTAGHTQTPSWVSGNESFSWPAESDSLSEPQTSPLQHYGTRDAQAQTDMDFDSGPSSPPNLNSFRTDNPSELETDAGLEEERDEVVNASLNQSPNTDASPTRREEPQAEIAPRDDRGSLEKIKDWLWGGFDAPDRENADPDGDDAHIVHNIEAEAPFVPVVRDMRPQQLPIDLDDVEPAPIQDEALALRGDGNANQNDGDVEDVEDLEGIMELIGLQGPILGLLQNVIFSVVLISMTVAMGIWLPYIWGKIVLLFLADPLVLLVMAPLHLIQGMADVIVDGCLFVFGSCIYWVDRSFRLLATLLAMVFPIMNKYALNESLGNLSMTVASGGLDRLTDTAIAIGRDFSKSGFRAFSIISHESLLRVETQLWNSISMIFAMPTSVISALHWEKLQLNSLGSTLTFLSPKYISDCARFIETWILNSFLDLFSPERASSSGSIGNSTKIPGTNLDLAYWNTKDRIIAVLLGYALFSFLGAIYLKVGNIFSPTRDGGRVEGALADLLRQAGGVMKVILIIGIEMIVFPLYCGVLLDIALLPLFANATFWTRIQFTYESPMTSLFIHWFVGTCYMFHFALFVSMCRKILRSGVLYFIRDPDDPTFHPVRDVLERSISTQLRKITFSALVYGALVLVCLGGVVWGISCTFDGVLPIHWSSNEPVLEFPIDLLFYNFLMPLAVRFIRPSTWLQSMYDWWFHKVARALRLTDFLFGDRKTDEEGRVVNRTWKYILFWKHDTRVVAGYEPGSNSEDLNNMNNIIIKDGVFVRAPASDQVRIPKGHRVFLEVTEDNKRIDDQPDSEDGLHGSKSDKFTKVYIPPRFRLRVSLFAVFIWLFAAATGVFATLFPLMLGRRIFTTLLPNYQISDIYSFSTGISVLGTIGYILFYAYKLFGVAQRYLSTRSHSLTQSLVHIRKSLGFILTFIYTYSAFAFFLPSLFALLMELYIVIPLHTYFAGSSDRHIVHFIQDWTLGVLYVKTATRLILWDTNSRPATALRAIFRDGILKPDALLATKGFFLPAVALALVGTLIPLPVGWALNYIYAGVNADTDDQAKMFRYAYPIVMALAGTFWSVYMVGVQMGKWRAKIRDEVYLIGERLHNFGEKKDKREKTVGIRYTGENGNELIMDRAQGPRRRHGWSGEDFDVANMRDHGDTEG